MPSLNSWERCSGWIQDALDRAGPFYTLDDVRELVESGEAVFWPGEKSAVVTQFWEFPRNRALSFWLAGGDLDELKAMHRAISHWGKMQGATHSIIAGRAGWVRSLGYEPAYTAMMKDLT